MGVSMSIAARSGMSGFTSRKYMIKMPGDVAAGALRTKKIEFFITQMNTDEYG